MATVDEVGGAGQASDSDARREHKHSLERNALGFWDAIVMAVAGSAPAYSIAATTALIVSAVGFGAPAALLWCGIPMMGIAVAYHHLNKLGASAGAAYEWVGRVLHPILGFFTGWGLVISATIFMVAGSIPAGQVTLSLFSASAASHAGWVTLVGAVWFLVMAYFVARGVRITANAQWIMSSIEVLLLVVFGVLGLFHHHRVSFSMSWLGFGHFGSFNGFVAGALIAAFYYWGWDVSSNLGEETEDSKKNSGIGGIIGVLIVFLLFELFTICINMTMTQAAIQSNSSNVLEALRAGSRRRRRWQADDHRGRALDDRHARDDPDSGHPLAVRDVAREDSPVAVRGAASRVEYACVRNRRGRGGLAHLLRSVESRWIDRDRPR